MKGISVIVCCYNSEPRLAATLEHLANQQVEDSLQWEVVVVDNASRDQTSKMAQDTWNGFKKSIPFKVVQEPVAGLSNARKKGYETALYEYLIFCDDDNWLAAGYVQTAFDVLDSDRSIGIAGGKITAAYNQEPAAWVRDQEDLLAVGPKEQYADGEVPAAAGFVYGAGMAIKKEIFNKVKKYNYTFLLSDRQGSILSSCGDTELCFIARLMGYRIFFSNQLSLQHNIPVERTEWNYFKKLVYGFGYSSILLLPYIYALHRKPVAGFEKVRTHWIWQSMSMLKEIWKERLTGLFKHAQQNRKQLGHYEKQGRMDGLWNLKNRYRTSFEQVHFLTEQIAAEQTGQTDQ